MNARLYAAARGVARFLQKLFYPVKVEGLENLDAAGGAIIVCNHVSLRDPILIACLCKRPMRFMGKKELFEKPAAGRFLRALGGFPVDRGSADLSAIRESIKVLEAGDLLCLFPQGHRYPGDESREIKNGTALLAVRCAAPVIPVHIQPPYKLFHRVHVRVRPALRFESGSLSEKTLTEASGRIAAGIWGL